MTNDGSSALLKVREVVKQYDVTAVDRVSFEVRRGERVGIVGESGSGKTTLGRVIAALTSPTSGTVEFDGVDVHSLSQRSLRSLRRRLQIVLQDPSSTLDSRMNVHDLVAEGLKVHTSLTTSEIDARVRQVCSTMRLPDDVLGVRPGALSGGQRQRVSVARSIAIHPELVILDEPVSALDTSVQAQLLNLLLDLQDAADLTYLFIVHDLSVARWFCDRILVMHNGQVVEEAKSEKLFTQAEHPYTRSLLAAIPGSDFFSPSSADPTGPSPLQRSAE